MSFNRFGRLVVCLALICVILVNCSPIRAEATMVPAYSVASVSVEAVAALILKGLGVGYYEYNSNLAFRGVVDDCIAHLQELGLCQEMTIEVFGYEFNGISVFGITPRIINAVRGWLFDSGKLISTTAISGSKISVSTWATGGVYKLIVSSPENTRALFKSLYPNSEVLIIGGSDTKLWGWYFDSDGILSAGTFENPLGQKHSSLLGVHSLSSLHLLFSTPAHSEFWLNTSSTYSYTPIFYDMYSAERYPGFLTMDCYALDWDSLPDYNSNTGFIWNFWFKSSSDSVWGSSTSSRRFLGLTDDGSYLNGNIGLFEWSTTSHSVVSTDLDLDVSAVASPDKTLSDGYSTWHNNSTSITNPSTMEQVEVLPIPQIYTYEDALLPSQQQIWEGTTTGTGTGTGTTPADGTVAGTKIDTFFESLRSILWSPIEWLGDMLLSGIEALFVPSEDYLTAKVEALRSEFSFADSIIETFNLFSGSFLDFDTSPPVITIDLGAAEGSYFFGNETVFIDLSWYSRYKPTVDSLLSAFMWLVFLWRVGIHLPNIVSGSSGSVPGGIVPSNSETRLTVQR